MTGNRHDALSRDPLGIAGGVAWPSGCYHHRVGRLTLLEQSVHIRVAASNQSSIGERWMRRGCRVVDLVESPLNFQLQLDTRPGDTIGVHEVIPCTIADIHWYVSSTDELRMWSPSAIATCRCGMNHELHDRYTEEIFDSTVHGASVDDENTWSTACLIDSIGSCM